MKLEDIKNSVSTFIFDKVINDIDNKIFNRKENFDYSERKDITVKGESIKIGKDFEIIIGADVEIDDFDKNHDNEPEYYVQFLRGGKDV